MVRVIGETGVFDPGDLFVIDQEIQHLCSIGHMFFHAQPKGFEALQNVECILRRHAGSHVHHAFSSNAHGQCCGAKLLPKDGALIAKMRRGQGWELVVLPPIEVAAINNRATQGDAMATHPFGKGMDYHIGAQFNGFDHPRGVERGINDQWNACSFGDFGHGGHIHDVHARIADHLSKDHLCIGPNGIFYGGWIVGWDECGFDAVAL